MRNISEKSYRKNQNTYFMIKNAFFEIRTHYEKMWRDNLEPEKPQMTTQLYACALHDVY